MPLKHPTRTNPKRGPQLPPVLLPRRNKATVRPHRLANEPQRGLKPLRRRPLHDAAGDRKHIRCSTCGQAISLLRARASPDEATNINFNPRPRHQVMPHRRRLHLRVPHRLWYLDYARTCTPPPPSCACALWRFRKTVAVRAWPRVEAVRKRPAVVLAPRKATTGGHAQPRRRRRRKRRKGCPRRMVPLARRGRVGRRTERRTAIGRICSSSAAWRLLCSYNHLALGRAGPTTCVAASSANRCYIGCHDVYRR